MVNRVKWVTPSMAKKIFLEPRRIMGSICERISAISQIVFEIFDHICGPFIYENQNSPCLLGGLAGNITFPGAGKVGFFGWHHSPIGSGLMSQ